MKTEKELIEDKLAFIRDHVFDESDFISDDGYDLLSSYVGSPYEVLCGMEQKIYRLLKDIKLLEKIVETYENLLESKDNEKFSDQVKKLRSELFKPTGRNLFD